MRTRGVVIVAMSLLLALARPAIAELQACFRVLGINGGCWTGTWDVWPFTDPERYWRMGIFDVWSPSVFDACAAGCTDDGIGATLDGSTLDYCAISTGCDFWDFPDGLIRKVIPDGSGAWFYFGLFDEDPDVDDSIGDHWIAADAAVMGPAYNNDQSPYYADYPISTVCGRDVVGKGWYDNYSLYFHIWFEDTTAPVAPAAAVHLEDGVPSDVSTDLRLDFAFDPGSDPETGIATHVVSLRDVTTGADILTDLPVGDDHEISICAYGCDIAYLPVTGHAYRFRAGARNGDYPTIDNIATSHSAWVEVLVDLFSGVPGNGGIPSAFAVSDPYPNPFNPATTVVFGLPADGRVRVAIYDLRGALMRSLVDGQRAAGYHHERWDGRDGSGRRVAAGVYMLRVAYGGASQVRKLIVVE